MGAVGNRRNMIVGTRPRKRDWSNSGRGNGYDRESRKRKTI